jgi:hypothetical protein
MGTGSGNEIHRRDNAFVTHCRWRVPPRTRLETSLNLRIGGEDGMPSDGTLAAFVVAARGRG